MLIKELTPTTWESYSLDKFRAENPAFKDVKYINAAQLLSYGIYTVVDAPYPTLLPTEVAVPGPIAKDTDGQWRRSFTARTMSTGEIAAKKEVRRKEAEQYFSFRIRRALNGTINRDLSILNFSDIVKLFIDINLAAFNQFSSTDSAAVMSVLSWINANYNEITTIANDLTLDIYDDANWTAEPSADIATMQSAVTGTYYSKEQFIVLCLTGVIDATAGTTATLDTGASCFVQSPVPDAPSAGATYSVTIPSYTKIIDVAGIVHDQSNGAIYGIGHPTSDGKSVAWSINGTTLTLDDEIIDTRASGYIAVTYLA